MAVLYDKVSIMWYSYNTEQTRPNYTVDSSLSLIITKSVHALILFHYKPNSYNVKQ